MEQIQNKYGTNICRTNTEEIQKKYRTNCNNIDQTYIDQNKTIFKTFDLEIVYQASHTWDVAFLIFDKVCMIQS